jgi:hypothetical protein
MESKRPRKSIAPEEITVQDGHLTMKLTQVDDGWYAIVESAYEGKIFEGRVTELSDLLAGNMPALDDDDGAKETPAS